ncbi:MAG: ParA family protein [Gammaproteobacteria bacterium]|nr:ParA family protein [Gammaproteobacteria bacterium]
MRIIAVMNQKGGVGKTTTTLNLSHALAMSGKKVTVIDMDPQGQLTMSFNIDQTSNPGIAGAMLSDVPINDVMVQVEEGLNIVPAGLRLGEMENLTKGGGTRGWMLDKVVKQITDQDVLLIDCPPSAGMLGMNSLFACNEVLIPVSSDYLGLHGVSRLFAILKHIEKALGTNKKKWLLVTRYNQRRKLTKDVVNKLEEYFSDQMLNTRIRENVSLAESPSFGKSIFDYNKRRHGAEDYQALEFEFLEGYAKTYDS